MAGYGLSDAVGKSIDTYFKVKGSIEDNNYRAEQRARQRKQWGDEDALTADINAARAAGASVLQKYQQQGQQVQQGLSAPTGGAAAQTSGGLSSGQAPTAMPGAAPGEAPAWKPQAEHVLEAYDASVSELAKRGRWEQWGQQWAKAADLRSHVRSQKFNEAEAEYRQTGDPLVFARKVYPYIADGWEFTGATQGAGADGKPIYNISRRNRVTGAEEQLQMSQQQILDSANFARDPNAVRQLEATVAMEQRKAAIDLAKERTKLDAQAGKEKDVANHKHGLEMQQIDKKGRIESGQISQRGNEERTTASYKDGLDRSRPYNLPEGSVRAVDEMQPDGSRKPKVIATNPKAGAGKGKGNTTPSQLAAMARGIYTDPMKGRTLDPDKLLTLTKAASILVNEEGMDANQALDKAATDLNFKKVK